MEENNVPMEKGKNGIGTAGFVCGLIGFIFSFIPVLNIVGWILCVLGFIFSLIGVIKKNVKKGLAIAGLILSCAGPIIALIIVGAAAGSVASMM